MNEHKRPEFVREIYNEKDKSDSYDSRLFEDRMTGYVLAALIGTVVAMGGLVGRGCYHRIKDMYECNVSKREPHVQGRPTR